MALKLKRAMAGYEPDYLRITNMTANILADKTEITLSIYKDAEARKAGNQPIGNFHRFLKGVDYNRGTAYSALKQTEEFASAEDV